MHIYEVIPNGIGLSHVVIAKSKENAVKLVVDMLNAECDSGLLEYGDFVANDPIDPNSYPEEMVIN